MTRRVWLFLIIVLCAITPARARAAEVTHTRVLVPDADNLQYLAFWVAVGARYFDDEGLAVDVVTPPKPVLAQSMYARGETDIAVLAPPMYLRLVAEAFPFVLVANLLKNDPIDLVVRRPIAVERGIDAKELLKDRLLRMRGLRVGVAAGPPTRLRNLFASQGLDAERDITMVTLHGPEQNAALAARQVDALYAHTPFLETALIDQDAVIVVDQSGGEVPDLADRQIHALVATRSFATLHPDVVAAMVRAIARAEQLVWRDRAATVDAVLRALPSLDRGHVAMTVSLYGPAVPPTPRVSADGFARELAFYPAGQAAPELASIDTSRFVAPSFADDATSLRAGAAPHRSRTLLAAILAGLVIALTVALREAFSPSIGRHNSGNPSHDAKSDPIE